MKAPVPRNRFVALAQVVVLAVMLSPALASGAILGQVDDFQDGTTMGWGHGALSPSPPVNVADGGPLGAGDRYLEAVSSGGFGGGSRLVVLNATQWTGDYLAAGVTGIQVDLANFGATDLTMRAAVGSGVSALTADWYASSTGVLLPADGQWHSATFGLTPADLTQVQGLLTPAAVLANVTELRLLSATAAPDFRGDVVAGTLGVDNVLAIPEPSLAWVAGLCLLAYGWRRRRACPVDSRVDPSP